MTDLRILTVAENLERGGVQQSLVNLLPVLQARGHRCDVAVLYPSYEMAQELEDAGVTVHRLDMNHRWNLAQGVPRLARLIRREGYHLIHAHLFFPGVYTALSRPLLPGPKRVVTFHNLGYDSYPANTAWRKVRKRIDALLMRNWVDGRIAVSLAVAGHYAHHLGLPPLRVIPNAFPVETLRPTPGLDRAEVLKPFDIAPADFVLAFFGRLVHEKGHRFFLEALVRLRSQGLVPKALIVGDGPLTQRVAEQVRELGLEDQVRLHGALPHARILQLVQAADLFVMASTHEGFPLGPAEAMALAKPVLATRVGGLPELIEDGVSGRLVAPGDPAVLADEIACLMRDRSLREQLGRQGRSRIESSFSSAVLAERWEVYYESLLENQATPVACQ